MAWKIPLFKTYSDQEDIDAVSEIIRRGTYWAIGPEVESFEKKIAAFLGAKYVLSFNSGTSALHTLMLSHDVKDAEVIVPSFTFIATASAVVLAGGKPVFAESEDETYGLDADDVEERITDKTKAIMTLDYGGFPSRDSIKLRKLADKHGLVFIEDAAESFGSSIDGKKTGTFGQSSIISFCQNKVISTGEGGVIVTEDEEVYERAKLLRSHGRVEEADDYFSRIGDNDYIEAGYNFRMPTMLAALGISQLRKLDKVVAMKKRIAKCYNDNLSDISEITVPTEIDGHHSVYQMYTIAIRNEKTRDALQKHMEKKGIMTKVYFNPVHLKTIYVKNFGCRKGDLPRTEALSGRVLTLPIYPGLKDDETAYITDSVNEFFK
jgi:perosamine synthetase